MEKANIHSSKPYLPLQMRIGTEFMIEIVDLKIRLKSHVVGMEDFKYILVDATSLNTVAGSYLDETVKNSPVIIRYLCDGYIYGFKTEVLNMIYNPVKLIFFAYPDKIEEYNVRSNPRYNCILPGEIKTGSDTVMLIIMDISKNGCGCAVKTSGVNNKEQLFKSFEMNSKIDLIIQLPGMEENLGVNGTIMHVSLLDDSIRFGVMFEEMDPEVRRKLDKFISLISEN